jgi:hypothetical protein
MARVVIARLFHSQWKFNPVEARSLPTIGRPYPGLRPRRVLECYISAFYKHVELLAEIKIVVAVLRLIAQFIPFKYRHTLNIARIEIYLSARYCEIRMRVINFAYEKAIF